MVYMAIASLHSVTKSNVTKTTMAMTVASTTRLECTLRSTVLFYVIVYELFIDAEVD